MYRTSLGLVLREVPYKEYDKILTIMTKDFGKITATARGCRRKGNLLSASCQQLIWSQFVFTEYRDRWLVHEVAIEKEFQHLQKDLKAFSLACYFAELCDAISLENIPQESLLSLILNCLFVLNERSHIPISVVKAVFELRCACESGYEPFLDSCHVCGADPPSDPQLSPTHGAISCYHCGGRFLPVNQSTLSALRFITQADPQHLFHFSISNTENLSYLCQTYLLAQLEQEFRTLNFYHSIK